MTTMPDRITGGVDTHLDVHVAAALDSIGGLLGVESFPGRRRRLPTAARVAAQLVERTGPVLAGA